MTDELPLSVERIFTQSKPEAKKFIINLVVGLVFFIRLSFKSEKQQIVKVGNIIGEVNRQ